MKKEKITYEAIKFDLSVSAASASAVKSEWRSTYYIPCTLAAVLIGILFKNVIFALLLFSVAAYHIVLAVIEGRENRVKKKSLEDAVLRADFSISELTLSHIACETVYEPHVGGRRTKHTKKITVFYFEGGRSWRVPDAYEHYSWSKEFNLSRSGLENISLAGDKFYFVSLQADGDVAYIYPCKLFELNAGIKDNLR